MKTAERAAALLVCGTLERASWRELEEESFAAEVRRRLDGVNLELVSTAGQWLARPRNTSEEEGFAPSFHLHTVELAMVAALYLHLRYLPAQVEDTGNGDEPSVEVDELIRPFADSYNRSYLEDIVLGHLRNAGFLERRKGRIYAGPYLAAIDPVAAGERAKAVLDRFLLRRYLRERATHLEQEHSDATD